MPFLFHSFCQMAKANKMFLLFFYFTLLKKVNWKMSSLKCGSHFHCIYFYFWKPRLILQFAFDSLIKSSFPYRMCGLFTFLHWHACTWKVGLFHFYYCYYYFCITYDLIRVRNIWFNPIIGVYKYSIGIKWRNKITFKLEMKIFYFIFYVHLFACV